MDYKVNEILWKKLVQADDLDRYLEHNETYFKSQEFLLLLKHIFKKKNMSKASLAMRAGVSSVYVYQIFGGQRQPSREKMISLCVGMGCTVDECQSLLKVAGMARLHPQNRRESIVLFGLIHAWGLNEINEKLYDKNEKTLD